MPVALLISTYEMGRQPFGLASAAAWLRAAGWEVASVDLTRDRLPPESLAAASLVGLHLPMHTATRLAGPVVAAIRRARPDVRVAAFGLYAPLNAAWLRSLGVDDVLGGEFEEELQRLARSCRPRPSGPGGDPSGPGESVGSAGPEDPPNDGARKARVPRIAFLVPDRSTLPPLERYAALHMPDGSRRVAGYTEASRGCKHLCRHCPIVPIYEGQFRIVAADVVLADIDAQVAAGAAHVTFGDPDFLNGPTHAMRVVEALHERHPSVTYDVTIKVEHLLRHRALLPRLASTGCLFVTSAVESIDDAVLARLAKGHTRADFVEAAGACREAGLTLAPTFVAFHPWLTLDGYCDLVDTIEALGLVGHVSPIQLAIRLLIPEGSRLLELEEIRTLAGRFDAATLTYPWTHPDARVDALQQRVMEIAGVRANAARQQVFDEIAALAYAAAGRGARGAKPARDRATVPFLNEPWYC